MKKDSFVQPREKIPRKVKCGALAIEELRMVKEVLRKERISNIKARKRGRLVKNCDTSADNSHLEEETKSDCHDEGKKCTNKDISNALTNNENGVSDESWKNRLNNSGLSHFMDLEERKDLLMTSIDDDPLCINGPEAYDAVGWAPIKHEAPDDVEVSHITITEIPLKPVEDETLCSPEVVSKSLSDVSENETNSNDNIESCTIDDEVDSNSNDNDDSSWWNQGDSETSEDQNASELDLKKKSLPISCEICHKKLSSKGSLRLHKKKKHHIDVTFSCELCSVSFNLQRELIKHRNEVHRDSNGRFTCKDCRKYFSDYRCFLVHLKTHFEREVFNDEHDCFKCDECDKMFKHEETLSLHKVMTHNAKSGYSEKLKQQVKNFVCHTCGKRFAFGCLLRDHINLHTGTKPYLCQSCGRSFAQKASLKQHARTHNSVRPFQCTLCTQGFFGNGDLKKHMRKHTGERPYVCEVCGDGFSQSSHLGVHRRSHTGERPFKCDVCSRGFTKKGDVVRHRRIHTGELPYLCQVCGKAFRQSTQCSNHIKIHHPEAPVIVSKNPVAVSQWI